MLAAWFLSLALNRPTLVLAQATESQQPAAEPAEPEQSQWFVGGFYRHNWIPSLILQPFFKRAPSITNDGFGLTVSHRSSGGFTAELGLGYMPYAFKGAFNADGTLIEDTEYMTSDLALVHLTGSLMWPIEFHRMLTFEIGIGLDLGVFIGDLERTEAFPDAAGRFRACDAAGSPDVAGPDKDVNGAAIKYCAQAYDRNGEPVASNPASDDGEQYHEKDGRVPPIMLFPMLPHLALRFAPHERIALKVEFAFGVAQVWAGLSVHVGLGHASPAVEAPTPAPEPAVAVVPAHGTGRVLGKLMEKGGKLGIAGASLKSSRLFSAIETDERGLFVVDKLEPGEVHFEISHPDYESGSCETTIPEHGGDVALHCFLAPRPSEGAISGQIKDEQGTPVADARIEIAGPTSALAVTGKEGLFALPDAPEGTYRVRVDANGFLIQLVEIEVVSRETALPQIILVKQPTTALVTRKAKEIAIKQEINFPSNSAEIDAGSDALLREIADVLLRSKDIALIEIQGHTDDRGGRDHNQALSQARAESVLAALMRAGVESTRMQARGYGQDLPLRGNKTAQDRAKNRRVQFMILQQAN